MRAAAGGSHLVSWEDEERVRHWKGAVGMSRVVVIGATGHIGTYLVPRLEDAGHEVTAVSRGTRGPYQASPQWAAVTTVTADRALG